MNDLDEILTQQQEIDQARSQQVHDHGFDRADDDQDTNVDPLGPASAFERRAPQFVPEHKSPAERSNDDDGYSVIERIKPAVEHQKSAEAPEWQEVDHPDAQSARDWSERKRAIGFERKKVGRFRSGLSTAVGATGNALTKIGAAGAQDKYTSGKVLGGIGMAAKNAVDTTKDLAKIGQGVDLAMGLKGQESILEQNILPGFNLNMIAKSEFAPGIRAPDTVKAAVVNGGTLLEVAGRGLTAASGRRALDFGDDQRRKYMERRDAFTASRDVMREKLRSGQRGGGKEALVGAVQQTQAALDLGRAVNDYGIRPEYEYSMNETADINNMSARRTSAARTGPNPSFDPANPESRPEMEVMPREVTYERKEGSDPLNTEPEYQTAQELRAGRNAKAFAAPGEALEGLGRVIDGSEDGQEAVRKGEYLKGAAQANLGGARTIGKGAATVAAAPLGLGPAASALVDLGAITAGGALQAVGGGLNALTGVGDKAKQQRALELRNQHYFGKRNFLKASSVKDAEPHDLSESKVEEEKVLDEKAAEPAPLDEKEAVPRDEFFDTARGRRIAERGLRARDPLKEGDYEKTERSAGLPEVDHGGVFRNFWHNRLKRPLKKMGQGLLKPVALVGKALGYGTGVLPAWNWYQKKKRAEALKAATNRVNNRQGGQLGDDDWEEVNRPEDKAAADGDWDVLNPPEEKAAPVPLYAQPEDKDSVLQSLESRKADAQINRVQLREALDKQNKDYGSSKISRGVKSALKMEGRDLTKENVTAWTNFERRHNETRLDQKIADRKRERAKDPVTGESFLEKQKREYLEWFQKNKKWDYADADMGNAMQKLAASDVHSGVGDSSDSVQGEVSERGDERNRLSIIQEAENSSDEDDESSLRGRGSSEILDDGANPEAEEEKVPEQHPVPEQSPVSPFELTAPAPTPITADTSEFTQDRMPFGYTPETLAEEQREWKRLLRKKA